MPSVMMHKKSSSYVLSSYRRDSIFENVELEKIVIVLICMVSKCNISFPLTVVDMATGDFIYTAR